MVEVTFDLLWESIGSCEQLGVKGEVVESERELVEVWRVNGGVRLFEVSGDGERRFGGRKV